MQWKVRANPMYSVHKDGLVGSLTIDSFSQCYQHLKTNQDNAAGFHVTSVEYIHMLD